MNLSKEERDAIEYLENDIVMNREKYKEVERKGEPTGYGTMHDIYKLNICEYSIILNLIKKLQTKIDNKDKIINEMASYISNLDVDEDICKKVKISSCADETSVPASCCIDCIKQYFEKKVEEGK